jgi:hypothetical protein
MKILLILLTTGLSICGGVIMILTGNLLAHQTESLLKFITGKEVSRDELADPKMREIESVIRTIGVLVLILGIAKLVYAIIAIVIGVSMAGELPVNFKMN